MELPRWMTRPNHPRLPPNPLSFQGGWASILPVIHRAASHSHLWVVQYCWTALTVWGVQLQCTLVVHGAVARRFIVEVVEGRREDGVVAHSFPLPLILCMKPQAVPCRRLLPYHNGMTNGAMKILEVQWPSLQLSKLAMLRGEHSSAEQIMHYRWNGC